LTERIKAAVKAEVLKTKAEIQAANTNLQKEKDQAKIDHLKKISEAE
jgi:hypothetical protein